MSKTTLRKITLLTTISLSLLTFVVSPAMASGFTGPSSPSTHAQQTVPATSVPLGDYYCPYGGVLSNKTCTVHETTPAGTSKTYTCPAGDTLSGATCTQGKSSTANHNFYYCTFGVLQGLSCVTTNTYSATSQPTYSCPSGYTLSGTSCLSKALLSNTAGCASLNLFKVLAPECLATPKTFPATPATVYSCATGGVLSQESCAYNVRYPAVQRKR